MKGSFSLVFLFMLLLAPLAAASITVLSPNGTPWCINSPCTITWTSMGVIGNVDIILRPANAPAAPPTLGVAAGTANDGSEGWTIPASVAPGYYLVRIRSISDPAVYGDSAAFEIKACLNVTPGEGLSTSKSSNKYPGNFNQPSLVQAIQLKPDLIVCKILPEALNPNEFRQPMKLRVHNIGKGPSPECYLTISFGGVQGNQKIKALNAGEFDEIFYEKANISNGVIAPAVPIPYTFHIDRDNLVVESEEGNNVLTGTMYYYNLQSDPARCSDGNAH